jgi:hypothetical protein
VRTTGVGRGCDEGTGEPDRPGETRILERARPAQRSDLRPLTVCEATLPRAERLSAMVVRQHALVLSAPEVTESIKGRRDRGVSSRGAVMDFRLVRPRTRTTLAMCRELPRRHDP